MNREEAAYAAYLDEQIKSGAVERYYFEKFTITLALPPNAKPARYTPDFAVYLADGELEFHEYKGFMRDDALLKLKCAADQYPHTFRLVRKRPRRDGGGFDIKEM